LYKFSKIIFFLLENIMLDNSFESDSENSIFPFNPFNDSRTENDSFENQIKNISSHEMLDIFKDNSLTEEEHKKKLNLFTTSVVTNDSSLLINKKRGRHSILEKEDKKDHGKFSTDNIQRKIQVHYLSFIISFLNDILKYLGFKEQFKNLNYEFKQVVNKNNFTKLQRSNIGEIVSKEISTKYKRTQENFNYCLCKKFETHEVLGKIFSMNYLTFLKMFYVKNEKRADLKIFGVDEEITLSKKTKPYYELLEKLKKEDENYINQINNCLFKNYLMKKTFVIS